MQSLSSGYLLAGLLEPNVMCSVFLVEVFYSSHCHHLDCWSNLQASVPWQTTWLISSQSLYLNLHRFYQSSNKYSKTKFSSKEHSYFCSQHSRSHLYIINSDFLTILLYSCPEAVGDVIFGWWRFGLLWGPKVRHIEHWFIFLYGTLNLKV